MALSVVEQIAALERERARLEGHLAADENWRQLQALMDLNGATPPDGVDSEKRLRRKLAANPYYSARLKIVEAITILRRLGESAAVPDANGRDLTQPAATWNRLSVPLFDEVHEPRADRRLTPLPSGDQTKASEAPAPPTAAVPTPEPAMEPAATAPASEQAVQESELPTPTVAETAAAEASLHAPSPAVEAPAVPEAAATPAAAEPSDDLTRIRGLTAVDAAGLAGMGIARFEQIAAFDAEAIRDISKQLGLGKRIAKANWIEQAADLAKDPTGAEAAANTAEPIAEPPSAASIAATSMSETTPAAAPEPAIAPEPEPDAAPQMPEFHSLRDASTPASPRIGPARERYTPPGQLNELPASAPQAAAYAAPQAAPPSEPDPAPQAPPEPAAKPSPRDWLAQRRRETAMAAAAAEPAPVQHPSTPPPIPAATHQQAPPLQPARISISTPEITPPEEAEVVITSGASAPEGRKLLVASAGALRSLRDRLLGAQSATGPDTIDPRLAYTNEEADIEIVGGHAPVQPSTSAPAELQDQPSNDAPPSRVAGRLSQMLGALKKRG